MAYIPDRELLIINDFSGYGRVSTAAMIPVFSSYGMHAYSLPTAILSNSLDYDSHVMIDTTGFMRDSILNWKKLGFSFQNISVGLINSDDQVDIISDLIDIQDDPFVLIDPIMAENGELYNGMYDNVVECNRKLAKHADILIPNFTEATLLADAYRHRDALTDEEYADLARRVMDLGTGRLIISGCTGADGKTFNLICDDITGKFRKIVYHSIPTQFVGTGDIFSAIIMAESMRGSLLDSAVEKASRFITYIISKNMDNPDHFDIRYEEYLDNLHN